MRRREVITLVAGVAVWPLPVWAEQPAMPVIGFLGLGTALALQSRMEGFLAGLREFAYIDGKNVVIESRFVEKSEQLRQSAMELVQRQPAVIVTSGNAATLAVKSATPTIPIIFSAADDPVRLGFVASFNQPGGRMTGVSLVSGALDAKRLELLHELLPNVVRVAVLIDPNNPAETNVRQNEQANARLIGQQILPLAAASEHEIETAFRELAEQHAGGLLVNADAFYTANRDQIIALAAQYQVPAIYPWREFPAAGGLMSYGTSLADGYHQLGIYAGKVLRGVKPADLPVVEPTRIEFVINLSTAKALKLEIPPKLLALADAVIE
jgi:putative ABC transport system substrate-binding protein